MTTESAEARLSSLELAVANLEERFKTIEITVNDIRWGEKDAAIRGRAVMKSHYVEYIRRQIEEEDHPTIEEERT